MPFGNPGFRKINVNGAAQERRFFTPGISLLQNPANHPSPGSRELFP